MTRAQADTAMVALIFARVDGHITEQEYRQRVCWLGPVWWRLWRDEVLQPVA